MRKLLLALGAIALIVTQAQAITLESGAFEFNLKDGTSLYTSGGLPRQSGFFSTPQSGFAPDTPTVGDESRTVFWTSAVVQSSGSTSFPLDQLSGLVYNLFIDNSSMVAPSFLNLRFTNQLASGDISDALKPRMTMWLDPTPNDVDGVAGQTLGDTFDPYNDQKAPTYWVPDALGAGYDGFPNVNITGGAVPQAEDAILWLDLEILPFAIDADGSPIYVESFTSLATGAGASLDAYLKVVGGAFAPNILTGVFTTPLGASADLVFSYTTRSNPHEAYTTVEPFALEGGWGLESSDPIQGQVSLIPEPTTVSLLGLGIASLLAYRRRQK